MGVLVMVNGERCEALAQLRHRDGVLRFYRVRRTGRVIVEVEGFRSSSSIADLELVAGSFEEAVSELLVADDPVSYGCPIEDVERLLHVRVDG